MCISVHKSWDLDIFLRYLWSETHYPDQWSVEYIEEKTQ